MDTIIHDVHIKSNYKKHCAWVTVCVSHCNRLMWKRCDRPFSIYSSFVWSRKAIFDCFCVGSARQFVSHWIFQRIFRIEWPLIDHNVQCLSNRTSIERCISPSTTPSGFLVGHPGKTAIKLIIRLKFIRFSKLITRTTLHGHCCWHSYWFFEQHAKLAL